MVTELQNDGITVGQGKSNIAPLFQSRAIISEDVHADLHLFCLPVQKQVFSRMVDISSQRIYW